LSPTSCGRKQKIVAAEGWKWLDVAVTFPYGHDHGHRRLGGTPADLTSEEQASFDALQAEYGRASGKNMKTRRTAG